MKALENVFLVLRHAPGFADDGTKFVVHGNNRGDHEGPIAQVGDEVTAWETTHDLFWDDEAI